MKKNNPVEIRIYDTLAPVFGGVNITVNATETSAVFVAIIEGDYVRDHERTAFRKAKTALRKLGASDFREGKNCRGSIWIVGNLFD